MDSALGKFKTKIKNKDINIKVGDDIIYGIRPEEINIIERGNDSLELIIKEIDFKGPNSILHLISKNKKLTIKLQNLSSNISESYAKDSILNVNFNLNSGNIFLK